MEKPILFIKSHVDTYTKTDGAVVRAHDDKRKPIEQVPHPKGYKPGQHVFFPHPDPKKKGKNGLGVYMGQRGGKSVVNHVHGDTEHEVEHEHVKGARGIPKPADPDATSALHYEFKEHAERDKD